MRAVWLENVTNLTEEQKTKTGGFEKAIGVSQGYLSRMRNKMENGGILYPPVPVLQKISKELGISIDMLLKYELPTNLDNLRTLNDFIQKIICDTNNRKIVWDEYNMDALRYKGDGFNYNLFQRDLIEDHTPPVYSPDFDPDMDYKEWSKECFFHSKFSKDAIISGNCYRGTISDSEHIYLVNVSIEEKCGWEIYMEGHYDEYYETNFEKVLSTLEKPTDTLSSKVSDLIMCIKRSSKDAYIGYALRGMIDNYMKK